MFRRKAKPAAVVPVVVAPRWQAALDECMRLGEELTRISASVASGPVQERLTEFAEVVHAQLEDIRHTIGRSGELLRLTESLDVVAITDAYKRAQRSDPDAPETESLRRQHGTAQRLLNSLDDVDTHLAAARMRIRELVLAAGELALTGSENALTTVSDSLGRLTLEADALRSALSDLR